MPDWHLIDHDPDRGVRKYIAAGDEADSVTIRTEIDDHAVIARNRELQKDGFDRRADMWHAASIPTSVMYEWLSKFGVNAWNPAHADAVKKLLNSSDYRWCKVKHIIL
ncbi:hypothetical protein ACSBM8_00660 [Sphingomonas sp. ASY06-1R]|jgi:hypothetical protein|uniref:hypothetical protein n=1 Tax=Sphingomonas sp. ASY06-1R TaxID=3445771 RepID=UPI003FA2DEEB